jgi:hypothetical protein
LAPRPTGRLQFFMKFYGPKALDTVRRDAPNEAGGRRDLDDSYGSHISARSRNIVSQP